MAIPKFTADASIGPTVQKYRTPIRHALPGTLVIQPQLNGLNADDMTDELGDVASTDMTEAVGEADGGSAISDDITVDLDDSGVEDGSGRDGSAAI